MARKKNQLVRVSRVEVLPPEVRSVSPPRGEGKLQQYIQHHVAELLARREDGIFQPFFQSRRIYQELKKLQSVPEQRKWSMYFSRYGCLVCKTKKRPHSSCGMCMRCKMLVVQRLNAVVKESSNGGGHRVQPSRPD